MTVCPRWGVCIIALHVQQCIVEAINAGLDVYDEVLHVQLLTSQGRSPLFLAHFDFIVEASSPTLFSSDHFDLFPKQFGKLLNAHQAISSFESTLTRGRWKEEWGKPPREFRPPGAVAVAGFNASNPTSADDAWSFLLSTLSGSLCASFEGMDPKHGSQGSGSRPLRVPWTESGQDVRLATLPYEPVCTENLTPWLKLLPCNRHLGLATLIAPLSTAESPFVSLALGVARGSQTAARLHASLDVVLPLASSGTAPELGRGLTEWLSSDRFGLCPAARSSRVTLSTLPNAEKAESAALSSQVLQAVASALSLPAPANGATMSFPAGVLAQNALLAGNGSQSGQLEEVEHKLAPIFPLAEERGGGLSVMRDVLSREGRSERTHGRYLLRLTNTGSKEEQVRLIDQLPFFLKPLWHTLRATVTSPGKGVQELTGLEAMAKLQLGFIPSDGDRMPTEIYLSVVVPPQVVLGVFLDVSKAFIQLGEFSAACEKGFDVGSAAWSTAVGQQQGSHQRAGSGLRFSEGLLVLLPMPDFSMPFNVIALSSTAITFFFGSVFRLTAAGRPPHWCLKKETPDSSSSSSKKKRVLLVVVLAGLYYLLTNTQAALGAIGDAIGQPDLAAQLADIRKHLPAPLYPVVDLVEGLKETLDKLLDR